MGDRRSSASKSSKSTRSSRASKSSGSSFSRWRKRRRASREAKHLIKEARRILRKHKHRIKGDVAEEVKRAIDALEEARGLKRYGQLRDRLEKLDDLVEKHLAFGRKSALREYTESIGIAVLVALLLRAFVVEAFKIPSGSMIPTLKVGDHLFVNKFIYGLRIPFTNRKIVDFEDPRRGEVIVFVYPKQDDKEEDKDFIKRIVAVGGDTVAIRDNVIVVNGKPVLRQRLPGKCSYIPDKDEEGGPRDRRECVSYLEEAGGIRYQVNQDVDGYVQRDFPPRKVPEGHVFVMGDNRDNSHDSRFWGFVPHENIKGRAIIIWWSYGDPDGIRWRRFFQWVHSLPRS
jgi:signal peptidase I